MVTRYVDVGSNDFVTLSIQDDCKSVLPMCCKTQPATSAKLVGVVLVFTNKAILQIFRILGKTVGTAFYIPIVKEHHVEDLD